MKLGFTNQAVWAAAGLTSPFWSPIYEDTVISYREVSLASFVAPRLEPEIVLGFRSDLPRDASTDEICAAIGWVAPGFEIVQCHYPDWTMAPADAIADAGLHGFLVVGDRLSGPVTNDALASTQVVLKRGSMVVARGSGADALGGPVKAIGWLLRLPGIEGVASGSIVTTGTITAAQPIATGEKWQSEYAGPILRSHLEVGFC
jgi:2-oxo-3-hexenedioate decarboxylase